MQQVTVNAIVAIGMTVVILTGGIDLSVGSIIALSGIVMAKMMVEGNMNSGLAIAAGIFNRCSVRSGQRFSDRKMQASADDCNSGNYAGGQRP